MEWNLIQGSVMGGIKDVKGWDEEEKIYLDVNLKLLECSEHDRHTLTLEFQNKLSFKCRTPWVI